MQAIVNDLKYAQAAGVMVRVALLSGQELLTSVHEVREEESFVSLHAPEHFGDTTTTRKVPLDVIASVTVTDVQTGRG